MTNTSEDRRHAPRYEVIAQANVGSGDEAYLMPVRNLSASGVFLEGSVTEYPELKLGSQVELVLSASSPGSADDEVESIRCSGRVVRIEPGRPPHAGGFGVTMTPATADDAARMQSFLGRLAHVPPPRPASLRA
ncbi:MAG TPA: PilZ domain-containing protein [Polyangia bacterium]|jgi:hypothetical protein|nr:PilZ domain-containing protein [Polyangia bacterium]